MRCALERGCEASYACILDRVTPSVQGKHAMRKRRGFAGGACRTFGNAISIRISSVRQEFAGREDDMRMHKLGREQQRRRQRSRGRKGIIRPREQEPRQLQLPTAPLGRGAWRRLRPLSDPQCSLLGRAGGAAGEEAAKRPGAQCNGHDGSMRSLAASLLPRGCACLASSLSPCSLELVAIVGRAGRGTPGCAGPWGPR